MDVYWSYLPELGANRHDATSIDPIQGMSW